MQPISVPVNGSKMSEETELTREIGLPEKPLTLSDVAHDNATPDNQRGIHYAESLDYGTVHYPDPERIRRYHQEWEGITGYLNEWEMDCD